MPTPINEIDGSDWGRKRERKNTVLAEKRAKVCDNGKVREGGGGKGESLEDRTILDHGNLSTLLRKILLMKQSGNV
jgi:hypothetical protein